MFSCVQLSQFVCARTCAQLRAAVLTLSAADMSLVGRDQGWLNSWGI